MARYKKQIGSSSEEYLADFDSTPNWDGRQLYVWHLAKIKEGLIEARITNNLRFRYDLLHAYYFSLSARMKYEKDGQPGEMLKKHMDFYKASREGYAQYLTVKNQGSRKQFNIRFPEYRRFSEEKFVEFSSIIELFDEWEKELRCDENELGLLMGSKEDPTFAMSGGR